MFHYLQSVVLVKKRFGLVRRGGLFAFIPLLLLVSVSSYSAGSETKNNAAALPDKLNITEWKVPWGGRPRDPYVDSRGDVWFCGQSGDYIARFSPDAGEADKQFTRFSIPKGSHPHNLIVDDNDQVWYAGNRNAHIGKLDPLSGKVHQYPMPAGLDDPHTLVMSDSGDIWFTAQNSDRIGRLNTATGEVTVIKTRSENSRPYGIKLDKQQRPWVVLFGTNKLASIDPQTAQITEITLPRENARPRRLEIDRANNLWYVDYLGGYVGRYSEGEGSQTKKFTEWRIPAAKSADASARPYGTALDEKGRLWIADTGVVPNRILGFDTSTQQFITESLLPSGGNVRHMYFNSRDGSFWFGVDTGYLARGLPEK